MDIAPTAMEDFHKGHPCEFSIAEISGPLARKEITQFIREYFACAIINQENLNRVVSFCENLSQQQLLGNVLYAISSCIKNATFENLILELRHIEIGWQLYNCLTDSMMDNAAYADRMYFDETFSKYIIVQENRYQLSHGTTGLSCWQASCDLANYLLKHGHGYVSESNILELGAGCGLLSIALAAFGFARSITFSDGNDDVLNIIRDNIRSNFSKNCDIIFNVIFLEWETINVENIPVIPDVIFAAGQNSHVVYDIRAIKPLMHAIRKLLVAFTKENKTGPCCMLANTIRNQETVDKFIAYKNGLSVKNCFTYENSVFKFASGNIEDQSLFLSRAAFNVPHYFTN
ncbi:hypothetical protein DINM_002395 [Dirofilaria immitis]|nr:hypothetical protein [Dirofilaria immitis]